MIEQTTVSFDVIHFIGRFHPLFLHLPIGLIIAWLASETIDVVKRRITSLTSAVLAVLTACSAGVAVLTGKLLALRESGYNSDVLTEHFWFGVAFLVFCILGAIGACIAVKTMRSKWSKASRIVLIVAQLLLLPGAHRGGSLTHGSDFLSEYAPSVLKPLLGEAPPAIERGPETTYYGKIVQPLLIKYCGSCHAAGKKKGDFNIDLYENLLRHIEPGNSKESLLIKAIRKPLHDDEHMPPSDRAQLSESQMAALEQWISNGASLNQPWAGEEIPVSRPANEPLVKKPVIEEPPIVIDRAPETTYYGKIVQPLLIEYCGTCHAAGKTKGGFNIDLYENIRPHIEPGNVEGSPLIQTLRKPLDDDGHMPPSDRAQLSEHQLDALEQWIANGARLDQPWAGEEVVLTQPVGKKTPEKLDDILSDSQHKAIAILQQRGVDIREAKSGSLILHVDFTGVGHEANTEDLKNLALIAPHIGSLVLAHCTHLPENRLSFLAEATQLTSLDLRSSQTTDAMLAGLEKLIGIKRLVLTDAQLTADSIDLLAQLSSLERLYLWSSGIPAKGIGRLRTAMPACRIDDGECSSITRVAVVPPLNKKTSSAKLKYHHVPDWPTFPAGQEYLGDAHGEIRVDAAGNVYASTDLPENPMVVFNPDGTLQKVIAHDFPGIHGFVIHADPDGVEYIYAAHLSGNQLIKLTLDGTLVMKIGMDRIPEKYLKKRKGELAWRITAVDVAPNGDLYAVDGYGLDHIFRFSAAGKLKDVYGGRNTTPSGLKNCHKIFIDHRFSPARILACDRVNLRLVHFDLDGTYLEEVITGLRRPSAVDFYADLMVVAEIAGRVIVLDKAHKIVATISENLVKTEVSTNKTAPEKWKAGIVTSPHGICFDSEGNVFVTEWNKWGRILRFNRD